MNKSLNARNQSVFYSQIRSLVESVSRLSIILGLFWVSGCATHTVKSTSYTPAIQAIESVPENLLMDVGVAVFDPGIDELSRSQEEIVNQDIRIAESQYVPFCWPKRCSALAIGGSFALCPILRALWIFIYQARF
jgi:hypothetical protein